MRALLLIPMLWIGSGLSANKLQEKKLEKLYHKNPVKCESYAKSILERDAKYAVPYFYLATIYYEKCHAFTDVKKEYSALNKGMTYAEKFQKYSNEEQRNHFEWDQKMSLMEEEFVMVLSKLEEESLDDKAQKLKARYSKLTGVAVENKESKEVKVASKPEVKAFPHREVGGKYFGAPLGTENIKSPNPTAEKELISILNKARKEKGMEPLVWNDDLARAARYHAYDMCTQKYFSHASQDRDGDGPSYEVTPTFTRIKMFYKESFVNSENIAAGNGTAEATYQQWFNSPGHYENMFNPSSGKVGVGMYADPNSPFTYYWVFCTAH